MSKPLTGIIFDWGNVLGRFSHAQAWEQLAAHSPLSPDEVRDAIGPAMHLHEAGTYTSPQFYNEAARSAQLNLDYGLFRDIWAGCIVGDNPDIPALLRRVKPAVRMCVLSNTDPIHWSKIRQLPAMREFFADDRAFSLSFKVGVRKPDARMYQDALQRLDTLTPKNALYVDDVAEYVKTFADMGGRAAQYNCSLEPIDRLEAALRGAGALR